jgi:hypothetical protein
MRYFFSQFCLNKGLGIVPDPDLQKKSFSLLKLVSVRNFFKLVCLKAVPTALIKINMVISD